MEWIRCTAHLAMLLAVLQEEMSQLGKILISEAQGLKERNNMSGCSGFHPSCCLTTQLLSGGPGDV